MNWHERDEEDPEMPEMPDGLPVGTDRRGRRMSGALTEVHEDAALVGCVACGAPAWVAGHLDVARCRHADGTLTRVPHLERMRAATRLGDTPSG